ncbi:MAG: ATP-binding protein [Syntrophomonadaceae bacterium]|nr:ATP-binding protein [Syntrophomonadaceae bacterium]
MIPRDIYMKTLLSFKDKDMVKIVTGIRRCGKSTLLDMFSGNLINSGVASENIIRLNFESLQYETIKDYRDLYKEVSGRISKIGKNYVILDEVQMVSGWMRAVNSFRVDFDVDIYITGSNAYLLSSDFATLLSGRYVEIKMLPLSFKEFLDFNTFEPGTSDDQKFETFLKYGGMPSVAAYDFRQRDINIALDGIYSSVILRDVVERNKITDQTLLRKLVLFMADNIGNLTSPNNIGNVLVHEGDLDEGKRKKNPAGKTISSYLTALEKAYVFYGAGRYDIKGKQYLKTQSKYYMVDTGIRNMLLGYRDVDRGRILENVVYFELLRRGYDVSIGKAGEKEIDFIAINPEEKIYYQVTETMSGERVRERELAPLQSIKDNYEKVVLSMDRSFVNSYEGIKIKNVVDFLLGK